jgi:hypothetical protein
MRLEARCLIAACVLTVSVLLANRPALAQATAAATAVTATASGDSYGAPAPQRPTIQSQRYEEDWSVLDDPALRTEPLDGLKYIPLSNDGSAYLSLGANLRERVEIFDAPLFGTSHISSNSYLLDRLEVNADLHVDGWEAYVLVEDAETAGKTVITPADQDRLDLEQAFIAHSGPLGDGVLKVRVGRQEFAFDLQRFVSDRDGPNVRQAYDAVWGDYEIGDWRIISFVSHPTQYKNLAIFDDYSNSDLILDGFRVERRDLGPGNLALYYLRYERANAKFVEASGNEDLNAFDVHYSGRHGPVDFDVEAMAQQGSIGGRASLAWAFGERSGYTFNAPWSPHLSLQIDAASGNTSSHGTFGTFNPLFPNGSYFSLASLTGYSNLVHVKPIFSVIPIKTLLLQAAVGFQWRETTNDAVYAFPVQPIAGTAREGDLWSGVYFQLDAVKTINEHVTLSAEFVHFQIGESIEAVGGHNANYGNIQLSLAW